TTGTTMRKTLLIWFGMGIALVVGFFAGRWSSPGSPTSPDDSNPETPKTADGPPKHTLKDSDRKEARARVKYLIAMLASKNPPPAIEGKEKWEDKTITFSKQYDKSLQVPVYLAVQQLLAEDEVAIDLLLSHTDDKRYSYSVNCLNDYNVSVSDACEAIAW